jgi:hypothetical protein
VPCGFAESTDGLLLIADGMGPVLQWDGFKAQSEPAGVIAPTVPPGLTGSGIGSIVGEYFAYQRYVDDRGNFSSLSPVSASLTASGTTYLIAFASAETPIVITTLLAHGLTTGQTVRISDVGGNTDANGTWLVTVLSAKAFSLDGSSGFSPYTGGGSVQTGIEKVTYTLPDANAPPEPKVVRRQFIRNTAGQARTFYVDVDTSDLSSTSFSSSRSDDDLATQEAVVILDENDVSQTNIYDPPPQTKSTLVSHLGRVFAAVEIEYAEGAVKVTFGSTTVYGVGTEWLSALAGRFLYVVGGDDRYEIASVDTVNQTLTLTQAYAGATDAYASYSIRTNDDEWTQVAYSEASLPVAFSPFNRLALPEDGDRLTGQMVLGSFVYFLKRSHAYRFTFQNDPAKDGGVFPDASRGCINNRCWVRVEDDAFLLDEQGAWQFTGGEAKSISTAIQTLWRHDTNPRINWSASRYFHAEYDSAREVVRFFVALSGQYLPRHALAYSPKFERWWLEEYPVPIGSSAAGRLARSASAITWGAGNQQLFLGSTARRVLAPGQSYFDGIPTGTQFSCGSIVAATATSLSVGVPTPVPTGVVGYPVNIIEGRGKGQWRIVTALTVNADGTTRVDVKTPWLETPDTTSVYQFGGIPWEYRTGFFRWVDAENDYVRRIEIMYNPTAASQKVTLQRFRDRTSDPIVMAFTRNDNGVQTKAGSADILFDMNHPTGFAQVRLDGSKETYADGPRLTQVGMSGVACGEHTRIFQITIDGVKG